MSDSRIKGLYRLSVSERIAQLENKGWLTASAAQALRRGHQVVSIPAADKMIENVLGVFGLPFAIAPNFIVNGRDCFAPLVVEEPSIVAGLSAAAALARSTGGFEVELDESLLAGQVFITEIDDADRAIETLKASTSELLTLANDVHPRLLKRGGGARRLDIRAIDMPNRDNAVVVNVLVDTCDAMGANLVNSICESIAPEIVRLIGGNAALRILSNLADHSVCVARVRYAVDSLAAHSMSGAAVRDAVVLANDIALADPHRAATHNKGVMNGIDAVAIATGNDWRAIEAGAHAYAARDGTYAALTRWYVTKEGDLGGELAIPLKPGIVGGTLSTNRAAALGLEIAAVENAGELAQLMAAVGLAQNFAALKALVTSGIQHGHMRLHARSLAAAAGAPEHDVEAVAEALVQSGEIKDWKAAEIVAERSGVQDFRVDGSAAGKVILLGEHAVVYGHAALAIPVADAVRVCINDASKEPLLRIREWNIETTLEAAEPFIKQAVTVIVERLGVPGKQFDIDISTALPRGMGLGSSAALAVALARGIARHCELQVDDETVNAIAFDCEKIAHGTPSGVDNTLSCYGRPMLFRNDGELTFDTLPTAKDLPLVIGLSHQVGPTGMQVDIVRERRAGQPGIIDGVLATIGNLSESAARALQDGDLAELGDLMNINQGLLNAIGVSTPQLEQMIAIARESGAIGAKLTGAGGGGAMIALCPGAEEQVTSALNSAGFATLALAKDRD